MQITISKVQKTANSTPFFVGPNAEGVIITVDGGTQKVSGFVPLFAPGEFPTDISGTNGAIAQLTGDGSLATAFFNEPFVPEVPPGPDPAPGPGPNPGSGPNPGPGPNPGTTPGPSPISGPQPSDPAGPEFSTADTDNLEETEDEDTVATDDNAEELLTLRGNPEECDADEITQENGVTQLSGDCLEERNGEKFSKQCAFRTAVRGSTVR